MSVLGLVFYCLSVSLLPVRVSLNAKWIGPRSLPLTLLFTCMRPKFAQCDWSMLLRLQNLQISVYRDYFTDTRSVHTGKKSHVCQYVTFLSADHHLHSSHSLSASVWFSLFLPKTWWWWHPSTTCMAGSQAAWWRGRGWCAASWPVSIVCSTSLAGPRSAAPVSLLVPLAFHITSLTSSLFDLLLCGSTHTYWTDSHQWWVHKCRLAGCWCSEPTSHQFWSAVVCGSLISGMIWVQLYVIICASSSLTAAR